MTVRNVSGTYAVNNGTMLPGYNQESRVLGLNGSSFDLAGFAFGKQSYDIWGKKKMDIILRQKFQVEDGWFKMKT